MSVKAELVTTKGGARHETPCFGTIGPKDLLIKPHKRHFDIGEPVQAAVKSVESSASLSNATFDILRKVGEGYAGQVYQAANQATGELVALKALRPESKGKERARNLFFRLSFGGNFAPATNESALRYGLIWQTLIRRGAKAAFGDESVIPKPQGYFWSEKLQTFVEIQEWIEGIIPIPSDSVKNKAKRKFMNDVVGLAENMGAYQLSRQYKWWTILAGANVLERKNGSLVAVDWRSGIALPFFLPLSPGDIPIILENLKRGHFVNFDYADFEKLNIFIRNHQEEFQDLLPLAEALKELDAKYRSGIKDTTVADWEREFHMDASHAQELNTSNTAYRAHLALEGMPNPMLLHLLTSEEQRTHLQRIAMDAEYRKVWFSALKEHDISQWLRQNRITPAKAAELERKDWLYILHKIFITDPFSQRITDNKELLTEMEKTSKHVKLIFSKKEQVAWMQKKVEEGLELGLIDPQKANILKTQAQTKGMSKYFFDLIVVNSLIEAATNPALLYAYTGNVMLTAILMASPVSAGGVFRFAYNLSQSPAELAELLIKKNAAPIVSRSFAAGLSLARGVGVLFPLPRMAGEFPEMATFLSEYYTVKAAREIPVYGVPGGTLEYYAYQTPPQVNKAIRKTGERLKTIFKRKKGEKATSPFPG